MPYEPLVILHVALTKNVTSNIDELIRDKSKGIPDREHDSSEFTNAIFYSINSCQKGLQQVDLGNSLIKSCVRLLIDEFPKLTRFHTLSPIPKFKIWLDHKISMNDSEILQKSFTGEELEFLNARFELNSISNETERHKKLFAKIHEQINSSEFRLSSVSHREDHEKSLASVENVNEKLDLALAKFLKRVCAYYLLREKKNGYAFNSVCNFHLRNGAIIYRVNFGAEVTEKAWTRSYGLMVNYGYMLDEIEMNCVNYLISKNIKTSESVDKLLLYFN